MCCGGVCYDAFFSGLIICHIGTSGVFARAFYGTIVQTINRTCPGRPPESNPPSSACEM